MGRRSGPGGEMTFADGSTFVGTFREGEMINGTLKTEKETNPVTKEETHQFTYIGSLKDMMMHGVGYLKSTWI